METGAYLMSISFAEIACKIRIGKLELSISSRDLFRQFSQIEHIEIIDISVDEWLNSIELIWDENRDPADRIITAFAIKHELPIVTTDKTVMSLARIEQNVDSMITGRANILGVIESLSFVTEIPTEDPGYDVAVRYRISGGTVTTYVWDKGASQWLTIQ